MKTAKSILSIIGLASLAFIISACPNAATNSTTANNGAANKSNTIVVTNANSNSATTSTPASNTTPANNSTTSKEQSKTTKGDYMVGDKKCNIKQLDDEELLHDVKCDGETKARSFSRDDDGKKAILVSQDGKSRFELDTATASEGTYTDETGKSVKVSRAK